MFLYFNSIGQTAFIENKGQWDNDVLFKAEFNSGQLFIEDGVLNYNFIDNDHLHDLIHQHHQVVYPYEKEVDWTVNAHCLKMEIVGANFFGKEINTDEKLETYYNYYLGNDRAKWKGKVNAYQDVYVKDIYPNIDFRIESTNHTFKYEFIVYPTQSPMQIKIAYHGAETLEIEQDALKIGTSIIDVTEDKPYAYQIIDGNKIEVPCFYDLQDETVQFKLPNGYNSNYPLIIDPQIVFSRYSSSSVNNFGYTATYDSKGNAYGAGSVFNQGYVTTPGAYDITFNGNSTDIGITKYSSDGLQRIYATYLGGNLTELPHSIVVNSLDELFVMGTTSSDSFPVTPNCFDSTFNGGQVANLTQGLGVLYSLGSDIIVSRFTENGDSLIASTYVGGSLNDGLNLSPFLRYNYADEVRGEIQIDQQDQCIITSCTYSPDFPLQSSIDSSHNGNLDAVVFKMNDDLSSLTWSTYLGGSFDDAAYSISFDNNEDIFVAGGTQSIDFPTLNAYQDTFGGGRADGFLTRLHTTGLHTVSSTFIGGNTYDQLYFVDINNANFVHVFGQTKDTLNNFYANALYGQPNGGQVLTKFNHDIDSVVWSTRFGDGGGKPDISPTAFLVDVCNQVFLSGWGGPNLAGNTNLSGTAGLDISSDALQTTTDNRDFYFMVMRDDASSLLYGSYFGGNISSEHVDGGTSRFDKRGVIYQAVCAGCGGNQDFPTIPIDSASQWTNNSSCNLGLVKYAFSPPSVFAEFELPITDCAPQTLSFLNLTQTAFNDTSQSTFNWYINNTLVSNQYHLTHLFNQPGTYSIKLVAVDSMSCNLADSITKEIVILGNSHQVLDSLFICRNTEIQIGFNPLSNPNTLYTWSPDSLLSNGAVSNPYTSLSQTSTFTLYAGIGTCIDTFTQTVVVRDINVDLQHNDSICLGDTIHFMATLLHNAYYNWQADNVLLNNHGQNEAFYIANSNPFVVRCIVTDEYSCQDTIFDTVEVRTVIPDIEAIAIPDTIELGDSSQLEANSSAVNWYLWEEDESLSSTTIQNPVAKPSTSTTYTVLVDDGICINKARATVYVIPPKCIEDKLFIPNAFTPNGDGNNDIFYVRSRGPIEKFYFAVYDRWGQIVFETYDISKGWDGTFKQAKLSPAAFAWYCSGICENGEDFILKGNVSILK